MTGDAIDLAVAEAEGRHDLVLLGEQHEGGQRDSGERNKGESDRSKNMDHDVIS
ncbi:hypothetical protein [Sphingomonas abietis]|uniref:Uncharacterized protein n=1 Tax=Sphingomonas abietis TaxID=3012344 RepID=A0ABY7NUU2_9SPHN|nr:hypothetical protein [Sphingomonas abietis]WBO24181.1 hypothetical protein PBT88_08780 [Sphingomonas abietis]